MIIAQDGEELIFPKISRTDSGAYLCIAKNGVPPSVSKRIILDVECKSFDFFFILLVTGRPEIKICQDIKISDWLIELICGRAKKTKEA